MARTLMVVLAIQFVILLADCHEEHEKSQGKLKGLVDKVVPDPIQNLFSRKNKTEESDKGADDEAEKKVHHEEKEKQKEHGTLDFFGRDLARGVGRAIGKVGEKIGWKSSNATGGLDSNKTFFGGVVDKFKEKVQAIYPGTKWCGDGNISKSYDDLGKFSDTDKCCREHDLCSDNIAAGDTKYGLINSGLFTRSNCECDTNFHSCLKQADSVVSNKIGFTYFTVLGPQCFKQDYPIVGCADSKKGKCIDYEQERSGEKIYQWFDNPTF